jgi:hypothetical protein
MQFAEALYWETTKGRTYTSGLLRVLLNPNNLLQRNN